MGSDTPAPAPMTAKEIKEARQYILLMASGGMSPDNERAARLLATLEAKDAEIAGLRDARDRATAAEARLAEAEKALEPFAKLADAYDPPEGDDEHTTWHAAHQPKLKHVRAARAFLAKGGSDGVR